MEEENVICRKLLKLNVAQGIGEWDNVVPYLRTDNKLNLQLLYYSYSSLGFQIIKMLKLFYREF